MGKQQSRKTNEVLEKIRPQFLKEYLGQDDIKKNLEVYLHSALIRKKAIDHMIFYGPPGLGKTTLAYIVGNELNVKVHCINGSTLETTGEIAAILSTIGEREILFIDEIHRIPKPVEELLYSAMEDFHMPLVVSNDKSASDYDVEISHFTLIGATTRFGDLSAPFRNRFSITSKLNFYKIEELIKIIERSARVLGMKIEEKAAREIATRSRGTPRIANNLLKRVFDFAIYKNKNVIDLKTTTEALNAMNIDALGLCDGDINYLSHLINRFNGGPVGLETISSSISEAVQNVEEAYEPFLLSLGFINRTPRGRVITDIGRQHFEKYHSK